MQKRKTHTTNSWKRAFGFFFYAIFCGLVLAGGAGFRWVKSSDLIWTGLTTVAKDKMGFATAPAFEGRDSVNLLVLGCDQELYYRGTQVLKDKARSDMMMVVKLDFKNNRVSGVSIPRDTVVAVPGHRSQKINGYHMIGGPDLAEAAVETLLPVNIDRVIVLDFDAFQEMVDLVGGVDIFVPKRMYHVDKAAKLYIDLKPGRQTLDGYNAMCFVRFRKSDDDFKRQERQRDFMLAFKESVMKNPMKLPQVAEKSKEVMGNALNNEELVYVARFIQKVGNDNIKIGMIPVYDIPGTYDLAVDEAKLHDTLAQYHLADDFQTRPTQVSAR